MLLTLLRKIKLRGVHGPRFSVSSCLLRFSQDFCAFSLPSLVSQFQHVVVVVDKLVRSALNSVEWKMYPL